jgi:hypothetical protein
MKKILCGIALTGILSTVCAHDSWAPHTHAIENYRSDLFYLAIAGVAAFLLAGLALRARLLSKRRETKPARVQKAR